MATCTPPSSPARASRSRSPKTRCACTSSLETHELSARDARARQGRAVLRAAADLAGRRGVRADHGPQRPLGAARHLRPSRCPAVGSPATSTATGSRSRCASSIRRASLRRGARDAGAARRAHPRRRRTVLQALSRGRDRALRRQAHPVAVLPRRQPGRPQPELPAPWAPHHEQVGAGAFATSEPESCAASSSSCPRTPRCSRGRTSTPSAAC